VESLQKGLVRFGILYASLHGVEPLGGQECARAIKCTWSQSSTLIVMYLAMQLLVQNPCRTLYNQGIGSLVILHATFGICMILDP